MYAPDDKTPHVAIIILNWNGWKDTLACIESCRHLTWPHFRTIVVDNGSSDDSEKQLRSHAPCLEILQTGANLGFAGGNNIGIKHALSNGADYVWLLNNDTIIDPAALTALVSSLQQNRNAVCAGSKIYYFDEPQRLWFAGGIWEKGWLRLRQQGAGQIDHGQFDVQRQITSVSGCSMLIKATAFEQIGLLNEDYFLYWEDTDWCARADKSGYTALFVPASKVWHKVSASVAPRSMLQYYYYIRNGLYFCNCYDRQLLPLLLFYTTLDVISGLFRGNIAMLHGYCRAIADFLRGHRGVL